MTNNESDSLIDKYKGNRLNNLGLPIKFIITLSCFLALIFLFLFIYHPKADTFIEAVQEIKDWMILYRFVCNIILGLLFNIKLYYIIPIAIMVFIIQIFLTWLISYNLLSFNIYPSFDQSTVVITKLNSISFLTWTAVFVFILQHTIHFFTWAIVSKIKRLHSAKKTA